MKNGCDLTLLDNCEFAVERRIDGEGMNFCQSVNGVCNGKELSASPTCKVGLMSQDQMVNFRRNTGGSHRYVHGAELHQGELQAVMSGSESP